MNKRSVLRQAIVAASLCASAAGYAAEMEEVVVQGDLGSLPGEDVQSIFGFDKSLLETPRSASTVSEEMMERFNMQDIDELVVLAPGSFTQSFFGVAGGLDVRGTPGETYFRGMKRLDNPGNYPTPIGASDRVDIVRGPASPIHGPSKIGGYLNFNPKSARIEGSGQFIEETTGAMSYVFGDWDKSILTAEVGGPGTVGGQDFGYYLYGEIENSGSYYENSAVDQTLLQASFDTDVSDQLRLQFGGMYHKFEGNQIAGWNRLTQDLVDNGTYVTGSPTPLDTNLDGSISHQEYANGGDINPFLFLGGNQTNMTFAELQALYAGIYDFTDSALVNPGTAHLEGSQVLVAPDDTLENEVTTLYFDLMYTTKSDWTITNKVFYEGYENLNENAYGFSQFHDSYVLEDKLVFAKTWELDGLAASVQISPSIRYTDFEHGDDFTNEYFDRRDLTRPSGALDRRLLATRINDDYTTYSYGDYLDLGFAVLGDFTWDSGLSITLGARYDTIDIESTEPSDLILGNPNGTPNVNASDDVGGVSWTASLSYDFGGIIPYVTASTQSTVIAGQGAEIDPYTVQADGAFDDSDLIEFGLKGSLVDNALYFAIAVYEQERTDFSAQSIVTNQTSNTEGSELEIRWVVNEQLILTAGYSHIEVINLSTLQNGSRFSFFGAEDFPNIDPSVFYGGAPIGNAVSADARRAGMPEDIFSFSGTYDFMNGWAVSGSVVSVEEVCSSLTCNVMLPDYTLVNVGLVYETENWVFNVTGKNLTDERYFRANFPNLFGAQIVLPELPRHFQARVQYRF